MTNSAITLALSEQPPATSSIITGSGRVMEAPRLSFAAINSLTGNQTLAVRVPNYTLPETARELADRLLSHPLCRPYKENIYRVGPTFIEIAGNEAQRETYYAEAIDRIASLREACLPRLSPIDRFRLELDEHWPQGARLLRTKDLKPMFVGLTNVLDQGAEFLPHDDHFLDAPDGMFSNFDTLLAANFYLKMPEEGGELELWDLSLSTPDEYEQLCTPGSVFLDRARLPDPAVVIKPAAGDLILVNGGRVHAVRRSEGRRVGISCFLGIRASDRQIVFWD